MSTPFMIASVDHIAELGDILDESRRMLEELEWAGNIGQNGYGCAVCGADVYHRRGGDHAVDCRLAALLAKLRRTTSDPKRDD
jgi:hypothetical protein